MAIDEQKAVEFARTVLEGWPQTLDDFMVVEWDSHNEGHALVIAWLFEIAMDDEIDWDERMWARDNLLRRLRELAEAHRTEGESPPEYIPPEIWALSLLIASGNMEPPPKPRGAGTAANAMRNRKMLHIEKRLREEHGCTREVAIGVIAKAAHLSEEGVRSALNRMRDRLSRSSRRPE